MLTANLLLSFAEVNGTIWSIGAALEWIHQHNAPATGIGRCSFEMALRQLMYYRQQISDLVPLMRLRYCRRTLRFSIVVLW